jgi:hypothetical protein
VNHKVFCFSFWIFTLYTTYVWYVQFCVNITLEYWWKNSESILELLCILNESWNPYHGFWLLRIIENLGNKEIITLIRKMCEYSLYRN